MALSAEDLQLVESMRQREYNLKRRQRAANAVYYESRRYRRVLVAGATLVVACVATGIFFGQERLGDTSLSPWRAPVLLVVTSIVVGPLLAQALSRTRFGRRLLAKKEAKLHRKYLGNLGVGRRWMQFYYRGEDISPYVPQILYVLETERRFDSVQAALEFVKEHHHANAQAEAHELQQFNAVAAQAKLVMVSSVNAHGQPSSYIMNFVKTDQPGVWYITIAPDTPRAREFDAGRVALITVPTEDGSVISSRDVRIRRAGKTFTDVADLYLAQVPGYLDGMTREDKGLELVYELSLQSAEVDRWASHDRVSLREPNEPAHGRLIEPDDVVPQQRREAHPPGLPAEQPRQT